MIVQNETTHSVDIGESMGLVYHLSIRHSSVLCSTSNIEMGLVFIAIIYDFKLYLLW